VERSKGGAKRQSLRVIVGRGIHSSGGQPTLPRVVAVALDAAGYTFIDRDGALTVELKHSWR
jgi:hypothetical protein